MKQKQKGVLKPNIRLTLAETDGDDSLLQSLHIGDHNPETDLMLRQQLAKSQKSPKDGQHGEPVSELDLLCQACSGPLDLFGSWGKRETVYIAIHGPPASKRYQLGVYKDKNECDRKGKAQPEVDLLKVASVQPDPARPEVFVLVYVDADKIKKRLQFRRIDRARDVWVEMLQLLIKQVHEERATKKK